MGLFGELSYALISTPQTRFAQFIPHVVTREVYRDSLIITDHPVERGAPITDHSFVRPKTIEIECGFSNSNAGAEGYIESVYEQLVKVQQLRKPFTVSTPRRMYKNMLASDIIVTRDERTNSVLACALVFREVILTSTQSGGSTASGGNSEQAQPERTASEADSGSRQPVTDQSFAGGFSTGGYDVNAVGETVPSSDNNFPNPPVDAPAPLDPDLIFSPPPSTGLPYIPGGPTPAYTPVPQFNSSMGNPPFVP